MQLFNNKKNILDVVIINLESNSCQKYYSTYTNMKVTFLHKCEQAITLDIHLSTHIKMFC